MSEELLDATWDPTRESPRGAFETGLRHHELRYQRCADCDRAVFFPRVLCPHCGGSELNWVTSAGHGVVYASTVVRSRSGAYSVALIDLDEGFRMMSRIVGVPDGCVEVGMEVVADFEEPTEEDDLPIVVFRRPVG